MEIIMGEFQRRWFGRLTVIVVWVAMPVVVLSGADPFVGIEMTASSPQSVEIPARVTGVLERYLVREGDALAKDQLIARLDDEVASREAKLTEINLRIAKQQSDSFQDDQLAARQLEQQQELAKQSALLTDVAAQRASSQIRIQAAAKAEMVAKNELVRATNARKEFIEAVSKSQLDGIRLAFEKSQLEHQQAAFEQKMESLMADSEAMGARAQEIGVKIAKLMMTQKESDKAVLSLQETKNSIQLELAQLNLHHHRIHCPVDGVVAKLYRSEGEWIRQGDPVCRVVRLDRLRCKGFVAANAVSKLRKLSVVRLSVQQVDESVQVDGRIVFINPEIDGVTGEAEFWVEFENPEHRVLPGMRLRIDAIE